MRRLGIALVTSTLLLAACGGSDEPEAPTTPAPSSATDPEETDSEETGSEETDSEETGPESNGDDGADSSATDDAPGTDGDSATDGGTVDDDETSEDAAGQDPEETTGHPGIEVPTDGGLGGDPGQDTTLDRPSEEILAEAGLLEDGAIVLGPAPPQDEQVNLAVCDYLFGTPDEIAATVGLEDGAEIALAPGSGHRNLGGAGGGPQCLYFIDGVDALGLLIVNKEIEDMEGADESLVGSTTLQSTDGRDHFGYVAVNPEWDGTITLDEAGAIALLQDAATRWGGASV